MGSPLAECPTAPLRENGLWIEGEELDFMTLTGWDGPSGLRGSQGLQVTLHFSTQGREAQGRRPLFSFP